MFRRIAIALMVFFGCGIAFAEEYLVVDDVMVETQGDNAVQARERAFLQGQKMALNQLLAKKFFIFLDTPPVSDDDLSSMIYDFSVKEEKVSTRGYQAIYKYRFFKSKVLKLVQSTKKTSPQTKAVSGNSKLKKNDEMLVTNLKSDKSSLSYEKACIQLEIPISDFSEWSIIEKQLHTSWKGQYRVRNFSNELIILDLPESLLENKLSGFSFEKINSCVYRMVKNDTAMKDMENDRPSGKKSATEQMERDAYSRP